MFGNLAPLEFANAAAGQDGVLDVVPVRAGLDVVNGGAAALSSARFRCGRVQLAFQLFELQIVEDITHRHSPPIAIA